MKTWFKRFWHALRGHPGSQPVHGFSVCNGDWWCPDCNVYWID